jgi:hypothetical protein
MVARTVFPWLRQSSEADSAFNVRREKSPESHSSDRRIKTLGTTDVGKVSALMAKALPPAYNRPQPFSPGCRHEQHPQKMLDVSLAVVRSLAAQAEEPVDGIALTGRE